MGRGKRRAAFEFGGKEKHVGGGMESRSCGERPVQGCFWISGHDIFYPKRNSSCGGQVQSEELRRLFSLSLFYFTWALPIGRGRLDGRDRSGPIFGEGPGL
jgi:hypothetical protein